jgi:hypothetical protein
MTWRDEAACKGMADTGIFWSGKKEDKAMALDVCSQCPVRSECLAEGVAFKDTGVIRGGKEL